MSTGDTLSDEIETISDAEADGEQLVTVAIPADESLEAMRGRVEEDHAEAEYLNDREEVRKPLKQALEETRRILHDYDETPENGLVAYVGTVEGDLVTKVFDDLPDPVTEATYGYANEFDTTPLEPTTSGTETYGLVVVARESAVVGRYDGETIEQIETVESDVPSKQAAEGGKEDRFEGRSQERKAEFFETVGDVLSRTFLEAEHGESETDAPAHDDVSIAGLVLGGSEVIVEEFRKGDHLPDRLADVTVGSFSVEYGSEAGLRRLVDAAEEADALDTTDARAALDRFLDALAADDESAVGGRDDVDEALEYGAVETLLLSESLPAEDAQTLRARAEEKEATCVVVPEALDRAERLQAGFDGVGAVLRFDVE
ncbi:peptide chain release factor 1 [Halogranum amylolyticum]|uniref:Peptide chain release factor 1 n=1 Tax=Halogranum amylolyticum TaxID=660520 RepID=A0A1H8NJK4_9EURY|nr:peptide chain release factor 1 [Halogranum amylolyticum]SEO29746.1 peptide chain release factor 1 [Halogranum amylolyticum]